MGLNIDHNDIIYRVSTPSVSENKSTSKTFAMAIQGGEPREITDTETGLADRSNSPDGKYQIVQNEVKVSKVFGTDFYPELK